MSEHMIVFGGEGLLPRAGLVTMAPGLGLTNRVVVDHHFAERARLGRLMTALGFNPFAVGLGLDEDGSASTWGRLKSGRPCVSGPTSPTALSRRYRG